MIVYRLNTIVNYMLWSCEIVLGMIRGERKDGGEGEERGLRKGAERGYRDREKANLKRRIRNIDTCLCLLRFF